MAWTLAEEMRADDEFSSSDGIHTYHVLDVKLEPNGMLQIVRIVYFCPDDYRLITHDYLFGELILRVVTTPTEALAQCEARRLYKS